MKQINVIEENPSVTRKITAFVVQVEEKWMRLKSEQLQRDDIIQISAVVATKYLPRQIPPKPKLVDEFLVGDKILMDVRPDTGHFVPQRLHAMQFIRPEGTRLVADGLVISLSETGAVIRSSCYEDFTFPYARILPSETPIRIGMSVTFEVIISNDQIRGLNMSVTAVDETSVRFPVYRGRGTVCFDNGVPYVQIKGSHETTTRYPVNEWAYYGCGVPIMFLEGNTIDCTICPNDPRSSEYFLEVVYFELCPEATVPLEERRETSRLDGVRHFGTSVYSQTSFREVQCNRFLNEENLQMLREFFLYIIEHADAVSFERMTRQYPHFTEIMIEELGLNEAIEQSGNINPARPTGYQEVSREMTALNLGTNEFQPTDGNQVSIQEGGQRLPTAPNFSPDAVFGRGDGTDEEAEDELEEAAAALPISPNRQPPNRLEDVFDNRVPASDRSRGGNANMGSPNIDDSFSSDNRPMVSQAVGSNRVGPGGRGRPIERLNTGNCIEMVGRTRIDVGTQGGGDQSAQAVPWRSAVGGATGRIGKMKPG